MPPSRADGERRVRRRVGSYGLLDKKKNFTSSRSEKDVTPNIGVEELRKRRIERLEGRATTSNMPSHESEVTLPSTSSHRRRRKHHRNPKERERSSGRKSKAMDTADFVYEVPAERSKSGGAIVKEVRRLGRDGESSVSDIEEIVRPRREKTSADKERKIKIVYVTREDAKDSRHRRGYSASDPIRSPPKRSSTRPPVVELKGLDTAPRRSSSTRYSSTPALRRTSTITSSTSPVRRSSFLGGFFAPATNYPEQETLVECLTCLSDDVPKSKSAKLKCGHRMCNSCLKRIFKLSVKDPQHMPPKCCTSDHIDLRHVDRLFDNSFKKLWNIKFAEYSTKNRLYCPARRCGEWIRPANIYKKDGKKYGECGRCRTKVCVSCNGKWHGSRDCPKDEATNALLEAAKQAGWQRCYNCRTMVELKEGCNHMTCRCTAEFCMICGLKWKTCNCPWFNYEAVEADRLHHMQVPQEAVDDELEPRPRRLRRARPDTYHEEMDDRLRQERLDERLARRLQRMHMEDDAGDDYQGGIGDIHGVGNGAGHFMNQNYVRAAAPPRANAAPPRVERHVSPPPVRRHSTRESAYNAAQTRSSERAVPPEPVTTQYVVESAVESAVGSAAGAPVVRPFEPEPRQAVLAGLKDTGRARNRVSAWRNHVFPNVLPEEGVLSV